MRQITGDGNEHIDLMLLSNIVILKSSLPLLVIQIQVSKY